ncbi:MAG: methionyl-tRNA formyltransferase [Pyrinomonadaceae bacterium]
MRLVFMGTPQAAVVSLERCIADGHSIVAVWTQPDRPAGRGNKLTPTPVRIAAQMHGISVHQPQKIKDVAAEELFASHKADLCVVAAYGRILPSSFLRTPRLGCVNLHFSLLPKYRGAAPVNWVIANGEWETGVTTILMDEGLDTGKILLQKVTPVGPQETAPELMSRLSVLGAELLSETLKNFPALLPRVQDHSLSTFAPLLKREDGLIDWTMEAPEIERRIRAFQPWPAAYTHYKSMLLKIWSAKIAATSDETSGILPGGVLKAIGDELLVKCGGHEALAIRKAQLEGKRRVNARDLINGLRLTRGARFV